MKELSIDQLFLIIIVIFSIIIIALIIIFSLPAFLFLIFFIASIMVWAYDIASRSGFHGGI